LTPAKGPELVPFRFGKAACPVGIVVVLAWRSEIRSCCYLPSPSACLLGASTAAPAVAPAECADFSRPPSAATAPGASAAPAAQANAGPAAPHLAAAPDPEPPLFGKIGDLPLVSGSPW
jgi:hypothetical protein